MDERVRLRAIVRGRVQGVSLRYYTRQQAQQLGITGYVRNRRDGTVEVEAEGARNDVTRFLNWLHCGSPMAIVEGVSVEWLPYTGQFQRFEVRF